MNYLHVYPDVSVNEKSVKSLYRILRIRSRSPRKDQPQPHASQRISCQVPTRCVQHRKSLPKGEQQCQCPSQGWAQPRASQPIACQVPKWWVQHRKILPRGGQQCQGPRQRWAQPRACQCGSRSRWTGIPSRRRWAKRTGRSSRGWRQPRRWRRGKRRSVKSS